jgi:hypothetical protein
MTRRFLLASMVSLVALGVTATASVAKPRGAVAGKFTIGILAQTDQLSKYLKASNVFCFWKKDHVMVHVNLKNRAVEHITATVKPRYFIARGGEHGSGFTSAKDFGFDAGEFRALFIDAGKPDGVPPGSTIGRCAPYLYLIKSG